MFSIYIYTLVYLIGLVEYVFPTYAHTHENNEHPKTYNMHYHFDS
jgi:hypothetical protein